MAVLDLDAERRLRAAAFAYLDQLAARGTPLVRQVDLAGFTFEGRPGRSGE